MTDLDTLHRAFAELERRADAHAAADLMVHPAAPGRRAVTRRPLLVGATAAALVAAVAGTVVLTTDHTRSTTAPAASAALSASPSAPAASASPTTASPTTAERFTAALAGLATFTVTGGSGSGTSGPPSASATVSADGATPTAPSTVPASSPVAADATYLVGVLTSSAGSGGFDVQPVGLARGGGCSADFTCTQTTLADGSELAVGRYEQGTAVTVEVSLQRADGTGVLFHLSNLRDPKGMSEQLSPQPPLTEAQMIAVVTSPAWTR